MFQDDDNWLDFRNVFNDTTWSIELLLVNSLVNPFHDSSSGTSRLYCQDRLIDSGLIDHLSLLTLNWSFVPLHPDSCEHTGTYFETQCYYRYIPIMHPYVLTTTDRPHWWQIGITFIKCLHPKIGLLITDLSQDESGRMAQLLCRETSCFEPQRSGFTRVQFPVKVNLWISRSSTMK